MHKRLRKVASELALGNIELLSEESGRAASAPRSLKERPGREMITLALEC